MSDNLLEGGKKNSKDFWLFLIFVDIIALAFFGFLIYQNLSSKFFPDLTAKAVVTEEAAQTASAKPAEAAPSKPEPVSPAKPAEPAAKPAESSAPKPAASAPKPEASKPAETSVSPDKKQSVIVEATKNPKTRKVTFRYFDEAKKVELVSGFTMSKPRPLKKKGNIWEESFIIYPGEYKYLLIIDGVQKRDPHAEEKDGRSFIKIN
ncbi:hypothetical protein Dip518_000621 [Parelusimicrobium proximum]|uniref:hypothetical protein n=1 Tax=Parelusimicrobium proximum TaxID=3228953 RepID=UPI003D172176